MIRRILLMGNPNVGKSVIFSRLTGVRVIASNYPGTTVEFCQGCMGSGASKIDVVDVPGTYTLEPNSPAEKVAVAMLERAIVAEDSIVVNVVDATNLERNLNLSRNWSRGSKRPERVRMSLRTPSVGTRSEGLLTAYR
jgi:ferrous iron transport protein B